MKSKITYLVLMIMVAMLTLSSCSVSRHLPEGGYLLDEVKVISEHDQRLASSLKSKIVQFPNTRTFGLFRLPLGVYCLTGEKDHALNRFVRNIGEEPRVYDQEAMERSCDALQQALVNKGYLKAVVEADTLRDKHRITVNYYVNPVVLYRIASVCYKSDDVVLMEKVYADTVSSLIKVGEAIDAANLNAERSRIATYLQNNGYYGFRKENITYIADTMRNSTDVALEVHIRSGREVMDEEGNRVYHPSRQYHIGKVKFLMYPYAQEKQQDDALRSDTLSYSHMDFIYQGDRVLHPRVLSNTSQITPGSLYRIQDMKSSYTSFGRLNALKYTNISYVETNDSTLDCQVVMSPAKKISTSAELDVTNTSGDFGVSAALSFTNRNLFGGSEMLTLKIRGAYENITHLSDYTSQNYKEYGADFSLNFPRFVAPFITDEAQRRSKATTQLDLQYNAQTRPEFDRNVFSASWNYIWNSHQHVRHRFDVIGVNLVSVPRKAQYFIDNYLNQYNSRNSIMKFNYEDLFIFRTGYNFYYTSPDAAIIKDYFDISHSVRAGVESSGNLLHLISTNTSMKQDSLGQYRLFGLAYAQYIKSDFVWTMSMNIDRYKSLLFHLETGVAYPYGNAHMLPFEKRYYAGGANGVRGWTVRGLGPGSYVSRNGTIDYINQSGDIKLDFSMEYRMHLFWKFNGALFVDSGNIWTIYDYDDQPNGMFHWDTFYKQIAVSYGAGIRVDLNFLILRFDAAMKAINPAYMEGPLRYPISRPKLSRDFAWHFAVGYPF